MRSLTEILYQKYSFIFYRLVKGLADYYAMDIYITHINNSKLWKPENREIKAGIKLNF